MNSTNARPVAASALDAQHVFGAGVEQGDPARQVGADEGDRPRRAQQVVDHAGVLPRSGHVGGRDDDGHGCVRAGPVDVAGEDDRARSGPPWSAAGPPRCGAAGTGRRTARPTLSRSVPDEQRSQKGRPTSSSSVNPVSAVVAGFAAITVPSHVGQHDHAAGGVDHRTGVVALGLQALLDLLGSVTSTRCSENDGTVLELLDQRQRAVEPGARLGDDSDGSGPAGCRPRRRRDLRASRARAQSAARSPGRPTRSTDERPEELDGGVVALGEGQLAALVAVDDRDRAPATR